MSLNIPLLRACLVAAFCGLLLSACGGGGSGGSSGSGSGSGGTTSSATNTLAVVVDSGPAAAEGATNTLFASVTLCTPGSTSACQTIDHVAVDTGSVGLRIISSALSGAALPAASNDPATGKPLRECVQFADGYTWGSVVVADVQIGGRTLSSLPLNLIGDAAAGTAPSSCVSGSPESTVSAFGANGVLGVGNFLQDCGTSCASSAIAGTYYVCPTTGSGNACTATTVALARQVPNPVGALASDNNGVLIQVAAVAEPGAPTVSGTVYFGINTESNNSLGTATLYTVDDLGTFSTIYQGVTESGSFIDSGSNGYYFDSTLPTCSDDSFFYCPTTLSTQSAIIRGTNGASATIGFAVQNADQLPAADSAFPGLAGPSTGFTGSTSGTFDWGLPFFFGRSVYVVFENATINGTAGPAMAF